MVQVDTVASQTGEAREMSAAEMRALLDDLLARLLGRSPGPREVELWSERLSRSASPADFVKMLLQWRKVRESGQIRLPVPPGHPSSPVVDPALVEAYVRDNRQAGLNGGAAGVALPLEAMEAFWLRQRDRIAATDFAQSPDPARRYSLAGSAYGAGDATLLRAMIADRRPQTVAVIGAGIPLSLVLDIADEEGLDGLNVSLVDPAPEPALKDLREADAARVKVTAGPLQTEPLTVFAALEPGDILAVDSSHILKTGSDLHHILFYVLPVLKPGVTVVLHNCRIPLEYTDRQIFERNLSFNEAYAVRALLMYSSRFRVAFSASHFAARREALVEETLPSLQRNPGGALWLEVVDDGGPTGLDAIGGLEGFRPAAPAAAPAETIVLRRGRDAGAGGRRRIRADLAVGETTMSFGILEGATGPVFFSLGVRKSGSTMLHKIIALLARANEVNIVDIPGTFFKHGLTAADWARLDLAPLLKPGNIYTGFRNFPRKIAETEDYRASRKVFMHRDPRDAIVSQYFSDAFSHGLPDEATGGHERFLKKREEAQASDIDAWVIKNAPSLARTLAMYAPTLADPSCLVLPYETYVFEKRALIDKVLGHFGWTLDAAAMDAVLAEVDVRPNAEDPKRFVRKATPGDHVEKLKPETTEELNRLFAEPLKLFGYA